MTLQEKLAKMQKELKAPKSQYNSFGKYHYRNCEDIFEAVKPLLGDCVLTISDFIVQVGDRYYVKAVACLEFEKDSYQVASFAREEQDKKGMDAAQITGAASSYARKYALNGLFLIDDTKDADHADNSKKLEKEPDVPQSVETKEAPKVKMITDTHKQVLAGLMGKKGMKEPEMVDFFTYTKVKTAAEAEAFINDFEGYYKTFQNHKKGE